MPVSLSSGIEARAPRESTVPISADVCVSAIAVRAVSSAAPAAASSSEEKLIVYLPIRPCTSASASFSPSTMSRETPRPGVGSDE